MATPGENRKEDKDQGGNQLLHPRILKLKNANHEGSCSASQNPEVCPASSYFSLAIGPELFWERISTDLVYLYLPVFPLIEWSTGVKKACGRNIPDPVRSF